MRLTVVGFWGGFPAKNEATSGYLLEADGFSLLLDCGSGVLSKLQNYKELEDLDAVWLSHYHYDHIADIGPLHFAREVKGYIGQKSPVLPIYGHDLDQEAFRHLSRPNVAKGMVYKEEDALQIGPFTLTFLKTEHPVPCFAARITDGQSTVVYTADTGYIPELVPFSKEADLLIAECSLYEDQDGSPMGHMNNLEVAELTNLSQAKEVLLTHLPHYGEHDQLLKVVNEKTDGRASLAQTGWVWDR